MSTRLTPPFPGTSPLQPNPDKGRGSDGAVEEHRRQGRPESDSDFDLRLDTRPGLSSDRGGTVDGRPGA